MKNIFKLGMLLLVISLQALSAQERNVIKLPAPQKNIGRPLMEALQLRQSAREFSDKKPGMQELSNLLWAAFGINREESGKRTAPSARNWQEVDIYVFTTEGVYIYNAKDNSLEEVMKEDLRALTGRQDYVKTAPVNLVYVADLSKTGNASAGDKMLYSGADVGFIAQNVYLYCASQDMAVVVRGMIDREALSAKLKLKPEQKIILAQTLGYPKK